MMADSTPREYMGKAFGFHRSMDTFGAALGPIFTYLILLLTSGDIQAVFAWTGVPGALAVLVVLLFLREKRRPPRSREASAGEAASGPAAAEAAQPAEARPQVRASQLGMRFWMFTAISTVFAVGNSSDAFIFLRTADLDSSIIVVPLLYFAYNMVYALLATPLGVLSDRLGRIPVLLMGYGAFAFVYLGWAVATQLWQTWTLFLIYGIYAAATEGVAKAFVADMIPRPARGTAMGWFNGLTGFSALPANVLGGWLWSVAGAPATFVFGAWMSLFALLLMVAWLPWLKKREAPSTQASPALAP
jgi:MFS family permease